jgi:antibiotic biosynthesis monooxygenase (ABM) superfamily enzyme
MAAVNWMAIYPLITVLLWSSQPLMRQVPLYVGTLILSLTLTAVMNFVVMPRMVRLFGGWINRRPEAPSDYGSASEPGPRP